MKAFGWSTSLHFHSPVNKLGIYNVDCGSGRHCVIHWGYHPQELHYIYSVYDVLWVHYGDILRVLTTHDSGMMPYGVLRSRPIIWSLMGLHNFQHHLSMEPPRVPMTSIPINYPASHCSPSATSPLTTLGPLRCTLLHLHAQPYHVPMATPPSEHSAPSTLLENTALPYGYDWCWNLCLALRYPVPDQVL